MQVVTRYSNLKEESASKKKPQYSFMSSSRSMIFLSMVTFCFLRSSLGCRHSSLESVQLLKHLQVKIPGHGLQLLVAI